MGADVRAEAEKARLWFRGMRNSGWRRAWEESAGLLAYT